MGKLIPVCEFTGQIRINRPLRCLCIRANRLISAFVLAVVYAIVGNEGPYITWKINVPEDDTIYFTQFELTAHRPNRRHSCCGNQRTSAGVQNRPERR